MSRPHTLETMKAKCLINEAGCWLWQGSKDKCGYGRTSYYEKTCTTHRLAYRLSNGPIPENKHILHSCDEPSCINPEHLRCGTHADNMRDMAKRGRRVSFPGDKNPAAKLSRNKVADIKVLLKEGRHRGYVAGLYNVSKSTIDHIAQGRNWI